MHTLVEYMYRDGSNYKQYGAAILEGELTDEQRSLILSHGEMFLPAQVGLDTLQQEWSSHYDDEHVWHELLTVDTTNRQPTEEQTASEFAEKFRDVEWDEVSANERLDEWIASTPRGK